MLSTDSPSRFSGFPLFNPQKVQQQQQQQQREEEEEKRRKQKEQQIKDQDGATLLPPQKKKKKTIRQAVGVIITDSKTNRVLMLTSRKREGALVLPRGERNEDSQETSEEAALRIIYEEAGIRVIHQSPKHLGTYCEANKRGKTIAHHWMYEIRDAKLIQTTPPTKTITNSEGQQVVQKHRDVVWVPYGEALNATLDRSMSHLALQNSSFA
ncbi:hypothetical protein INT45_006295 [Circinella minor]|uniref:Nudix hydrolase domain-containing protein n=1 Tax=Circinella minor TaxID=1195481 RepID=A0A8H7RQZ1_9FUNG|nr:hypothetical protein INT45_006295 [Circinella minor]